MPTKYSTWLNLRTSGPRTIVCGKRPNKLCVARRVHRRKRNLLPKGAKTLLRRGARVISDLWRRVKRKARSDSRTRRSLVRALQRANERRRKSKELDMMPLSVLKTTLSRFIRSRPLDEDVWLRDFQLGGII